MLTKLHCENFRKHADLTWHFTPGINAIRAPNEQGKSSGIEAITYALFGAKGLKETLDDVVTYGMPAAKLKVELDFTVAGVDFHLTRSKSGAELTFGRERVTGQTEVTKCVEGLLGASQDLASKLMLARQKSLGGALTDGATAAGKMIEDLANLNLIDDLAAQVGEELPAGNTAVQEGLLASLREQAADPVLEDLADLVTTLSNAQVGATAAEQAHQNLVKELAELDLDYARTVLNQKANLSASIEKTTEERARLKAALLREPAVMPAPGVIEGLRAKLEEQRVAAEAQKLHNELKAANIEVLWDRSLVDLELEISKVTQTQDVTRSELASQRRRHAALTTERAEGKSTFNVEKVRLEGKLIKENTCAFCSKDLTDVPEVVKKNSSIGTALLVLEGSHKALSDAQAVQLQEVDAQIADLEGAMSRAEIYLDDLKAVVRRHQVVSLLYARADRFIQLDKSTVPATWTWIGPEAEDNTNYALMLKTAESDRDVALTDAAWRVEIRKRVELLSAEIEEATKTLANLPVSDAAETIELDKALKPKVATALTLANNCRQILSSAQQKLDHATRHNETLKTQQQKALANLAAGEALLAEMQANNLLIKKLRAARGPITDKLWAIVLASVSTYFSEVRGERSVITRVDGKFKVNSMPVAGLSGSAEDVLGLAIRFALTKTFLGNVDFVILDEVAAACDDQRELAMLGLLATSGFAQTILVTHSEHADAFSQNIITI